MIMKLTFFLLFSIIAVFSTENENDECLQKREQIVKLAEENLKKEEKRAQELEKSLQKRVKIMMTAEESVRAREKRLQKEQKTLKMLQEQLILAQQNLIQRESNLYVREQQLILQAKKIQSNKTDKVERASKVFNRNVIEFDETALFLNSIESHSELPNSTKLRMTEKMMSKVKLTWKLNLFPNESSVQVFRDLETNEISFEDSNDLIPDQIKMYIEVVLEEMKGEELSNRLFDCEFGSFCLHADAIPFVKRIFDQISEDVDINRRGKRDITPLMTFVAFDAVKAVAKLIERHAKMEDVDSFGRTALHIAAIWGSESSCKVLLKHGANINAKTKNGKTALELAAKNCIDYIQEYKENLSIFDTF